MKKQTSPCHKCDKDTGIAGVVTVGERGQVVIPTDIRKKFAISAGDKMVVVVLPTGLLLTKTEFLKDFAKRILKGVDKVRL